MVSSPLRFHIYDRAVLQDFLSEALEKKTKPK